MLRLSFRRYLIIDLLASLVQVPLLVLLGRWGGGQIDRVAALLGQARLVALAAAIVGIGLALRWRSRRAP